MSSLHLHGEGPLLVAENETGYCTPRPFMAQVKRDGSSVCLGSFTTAEEAAMCVARSPEGRATARRAAAPEPPPLTSEEAREQARAEGLMLRVADNKTGYFGVYLNNPSRAQPFMALVRCSGKLVHLGSFATAEEAALCVARSLEGQVAAQETVAAPPLTGDDDGDDDAGEEDEDTVETVVLDAVEVLVASDDSGDEEALTAAEAPH